MFQAFFESTEDILFILSTAFMLMWITIYTWQRRKYIQLLIDLDGIVEKRSQSVDISQTYQQTSVKLDDLMGAVHVIMMQTLVPFVVIAYISILTYKLLFWDYVSNSFWEIFPTTFQFDLKTASGFLVSTIVQIATVLITTELFIGTLMVVTQLRFFEAVFIVDLKQSIKQLDEEIALRSANEKVSIDEQSEPKKKLVDLMQFYSEAKEFIKCFEHVNEPLIFAYLLYGLMSYGGLLLQMNNIFFAGSFVGILQIIVPTSITVFWLCYFCHFGYRKTQTIEEIAHDIQKLNIELILL